MNPLFLAGLLPVAYILFLFTKQLKKKRGKNVGTAIVIRSIVCCLMILALCQPIIFLAQQQEKIVFVVDQSSSMEHYSEELKEILHAAIAEKDPNDEYAIVTVGGDSAVESSMTSFEGIVDFTTEISTGDTNLEKGIELASSLFPGGQKGRIVLLTDGYETQGNVKGEIALLKKKGFELDIVSFPILRTNDVAFTELEVPHTSYIGENASVRVRVDSTVDTSARLRIQLNSHTIIDESIQVSAGVNEYMFTNLVESEGYHLYEAELFYEEDTISENNRQMAVSYAAGEPTVLIVEGTKGEGFNLDEVLKAAQIRTELITPNLIPSTLTSLLEHESIVFANVSGTDIPQQKMELIETAVKEYGKGFIMTGGESSFGLGGYFDTPIERLLPVNMDIKGKKEMPSLALMIVVDRSGSMQGQKLQLAKEAAARTVALLREQDNLGVIAFDDRPWEIVKLAPIEDKEAVAEKIRTISVGGGTNIFPALEEAYGQMLDNEAKRKHIILLTDGQSASNGNYNALLEQGLEENITLSAVAIGQDADKHLLQSLAEEGTGRYYEVIDASVIPSILSRETVMATRTYIEDNPFFPTITGDAIEGLNPVLSDGVPQMNAYIAVSEKDKAQTILSSGKDDPVLSVWQYGIGRSIAFTSDLTGKWSGQWPNWGRWSDFWAEAVNWTFPSIDSSAFRIDFQRNGSLVEVHLQAAEPILEQIIPIVTTNEGIPVDATLQLIRPGEYKISFNGEQGIYFLQLNKLLEETQTPIFQTSFTIGYSDEYLIPQSEPPLFNQTGVISKDQVVESPEFVFRPLDEKIQEEVNMQLSLIIAALLLFLIELTIRRFGLPQGLPKGINLKWMNKRDSIEKKKPSSQPFKVTVKEEQPKEPAKPPKKEESKKQTPPTEHSSQVDRLLSAKKRRRP